MLAYGILEWTFIVLLVVLVAAVGLFAVYVVTQFFRDQAPPAAATDDARRSVPGPSRSAFDAGPVGVLLLHGFSGSPASIRPVGDWLADHGVSSVGPRLPGHGTSWQDLERTTWQDWEREADGRARRADLALRRVVRRSGCRWAAPWPCTWPCGTPPGCEAWSRSTWTCAGPSWP